MKGYSIQANCIRLANGGAWVPCSRITGVFDIDIAKIHRYTQRLKSNNELIDVTGKSPAKSLVLLDTGKGVLSPFTSLAISKSMIRGSTDGKSESG